MVYLIGYMGVGKSTIAKLLAKQLQLPLIDTDQLICDRTKKSITEVFEISGENHFRALETAILNNINSNAIISCGGGLPQFNNNMSIINNKGISIYLKASNNYLFSRLQNKKQNRPLISNLTDKDLKEYIIKNMTLRAPFYEKAQYTINVNNKTEEEILGEINALGITF